MPDKHNSLPAQSPETSASARPVPVRFLRRFSVFSLVVALLLAAAPQLLLKTPLRNQVLKAAVPGTLFSMSAAAATGGWLTPLDFENVVIQSSTGGVNCLIRRCSASHGLLHYLLGAASFGKLTLQNASLTIHLDSEDEWPDFSSGNTDGLTGEFEVRDSRLRLLVSSREHPLIDFDHFNVTGRILRTAESGRELLIDPCLLMDHASLDEQAAVQNLTLIAPVLASTTQMHGSASVGLEEIRFSLEHENASPWPISGQAVFHELSATPDQKMLQQISVFSGLLGLQAPETMHLTVLHDSAVDFEIREQEIFHRSSGFMLPSVSPELQIDSTGSLRFDLSLDMQLNVDLSGTGRDFSALLPGSRLPLQVSGTISSPQISLASQSGVLRRAGDFSVEKLMDNPAGVLPFLRGSGTESSGNLLLPLLDSLLKQKRRSSSADDRDAARP